MEFSIYFNSISILIVNKYFPKSLFCLSDIIISSPQIIIINILLVRHGNRDCVCVCVGEHSNVTSAK